MDLPSLIYTSRSFKYVFPVLNTPIIVIIEYAIFILSFEEGKCVYLIADTIIVKTKRCITVKMGAICK